MTDDDHLPYKDAAIDGPTLTDLATAQPGEPLVIKAPPFGTRADLHQLENGGRIPPQRRPAGELAHVARIAQADAGMVDRLARRLEGIGAGFLHARPATSRDRDAAARGPNVHAGYGPPPPAPGERCARCHRRDSRDLQIPCALCNPIGPAAPDDQPATLVIIDEATTVADLVNAVEASPLCTRCEGDGEASHGSCSVPDCDHAERCPVCGGSGERPSDEAIAELRRERDSLAADAQVSAAELAAYRERYRDHPWDPPPEVDHVEPWA